MAGPKETKLLQDLQRWADGKSTLKEVLGYTEEELFSIARTAYIYFYQGKVDQARTLFQGLYAVNPLEPYFAKALGVVEWAAGNSAGALAAYDVAIKLDPNDAAAFVGRAEIRVAQGQKWEAMEDLRRAEAVAPANDPQKPKISAMLQALEE
jgi:type III secretion system low calcium response chaperone LcrH/SycD